FKVGRPFLFRSLNSPFLFVNNRRQVLYYLTKNVVKKSWKVQKRLDTPLGGKDMQQIFAAENRCSSG
ncbi:MAG: hypothetical protein KAI50_06895, partial [Desulfobacterales bacterium]|nr:hypothetical protein [Desulfobacterales bacterium]